MSDGDSFDSLESSSDNNAPQFSVPCCNICSRKKESISYCQTCKSFLCERCDFTHKLTVRFNSHSVVSIEEIDNVEDLERVLNNEEPRSDQAANEAAPDFEQRLPDHIEELTRAINNVLTLSLDLKVSMQNLTEQRIETIGSINETHLQLQQKLKEQKDQIIIELEEQYSAIQETIVSKQNQCDLLMNNLLIMLSNFNLILGRQIGENSNRSGATRVGTEEAASNFGRSSFVASTQWGFDLFNGPNFCPVSVLNISVEEQVAEETTTVNFNNAPNVYPCDSLNIPVVESEPSDFECHVNPDLSLTTPDSPPNTNHVNTMQIHKTFGQKGNGSGQFNSPHGFCLGFDGEIVVADTGNHRVQIFDNSGNFKFQFGVAGRHDGYLWHPRKVAVLPFQRCYVVCDRGYERSRMQIFTHAGKFVKKIYIQYIDIVAGIAITDDEDIVVVNSATPTVFIIGQKNDFLRSIDCTSFMEEPSDIIAVGNEFYICDFKAHSVVVINSDGNFLRKFGTKHTTMFPNGIDISRTGYVVICDSHGNFLHVVVYTKDGDFVSEYRCPYVKVSRCCGLKLADDGRLVTVDKNYHHMIVLEALPFNS